MNNKNKTAIVEEKDSDWIYKSILNGAFSRPSKTDRDVIGSSESAMDTS